MFTIGVICLVVLLIIIFASTLALFAEDNVKGVLGGALMFILALMGLIGMFQ